MTKHAIGDAVTWKWGDGKGKGKITDISPSKVTKTIKGSKIVRNGTKDDPVLSIEQDDGDKVLKLASETSKA